MRRSKLQQLRNKLRAGKVGRSRLGKSLVGRMLGINDRRSGADRRKGPFLASINTDLVIRDIGAKGRRQFFGKRIERIGPIKGSTSLVKTDRRKKT